MNLEHNGWAWPRIPKWEWGPRGWKWLHVTAINYPLKPTLTDASIAHRRIWNFVANLPCPECRDHATRFFHQRPPVLLSAGDLQVWVWRFHNAVNLRLGKPLASYGDYLRLYADEICWANWGGQCRIPLA